MIKLQAPIMPARVTNMLLDRIHDPAFDFSKIKAKTSKQLMDKMDSMADDENIGVWQEAEIDVSLPGEETWQKDRTLRWTDPLEVVKRLFGRQDVHVQLVPVKEIEKLGEEEHRVYTEAWTGDRWDEMQVNDHFSPRIFFTHFLFRCPKVLANKSLKNWSSVFWVEIHFSR